MYVMTFFLLLSERQTAGTAGYDLRAARAPGDGHAKPVCARTAGRPSPGHCHPETSHGPSGCCAVPRPLRGSLGAPSCRAEWKGSLQEGESTGLPLRSCCLFAVIPFGIGTAIPTPEHESGQSCTQHAHQEGFLSREKLKLPN